MTQPDLFAASEARAEGRPATQSAPRADRVGLPRARRTDPATSHRAAERVRRGDRVAQQRRLAVLLVTIYPGRTATELAQIDVPDTRIYLGTDAIERRYMLCRRLPECGGIEARDTGERQRRWWPL